MKPGNWVKLYEGIVLGVDQKDEDLQIYCSYTHLYNAKGPSTYNPTL